MDVHPDMITKLNALEPPHRVTLSHSHSGYQSKMKVNWYMEEVLKLWAKDPDPDELFNTKSLQNWIIRVAAQNNDKKFTKLTLGNYAARLKSLLCEDNSPYLLTALSNLDDIEKRNRLEYLKELCEAQETEKLVEDDYSEVNNDKCTSEGLAFPYLSNNNHLKLSNEYEYPASPKKESDRSTTPERIFRNVDNLEEDKSYFSIHPTRKTLTLSRSKKPIKRSSSLKINSCSPADENNHLRKKPRASNSNRLNIKILPRSLKYSSNCKLITENPLHSTNQNESTSKGYLNESFGEIKCINEVVCECEKFEKNNNEGICYEEDVVIENPTPPCSPHCTGSVAENEVFRHENATDNFVSATSDSLTSCRTVQRKISCSTTATYEKLRNNEDRKIKGVKIRTSSKEPLSQNVDNKAFNDEFEGAELPVDQDKENYPITAEEVAIKYPKPPSAPALTLEMFEVIKQILKRPPKEKMVTGFSLCILQEDLEIFNTDTEWLNDRNVDFYLELIRERSTQSGYPKVYIFHSFFYTLLTGDDGGYDAVRETTGEDDIFKYDIVFFPVNLNHHWRLVVVRFHEKSLKCYDSMPHDNSKVLQNIGKYLKKEYNRKHGNQNGYVKISSEEDEDGSTSPLMFPDADNGSNPMRMFFKYDLWTVENVSNEVIPQQKNAIDCGIFILQYAEYLSREKSFDFDQSHIPYFRKRMIYETYTKQLLTTSSGCENIGNS